MKLNKEQKKHPHHKNHNVWYFLTDWMDGYDKKIFGTIDYDDVTEFDAKIHQIDFDLNADIIL